MLTRLLKWAARIGHRLVHAFDSVGSSDWAQWLSKRIKSTFGLRISGVRIALYATAAVLTLLLVAPAYVALPLIRPFLNKPSETTIDHRIALLSRVPARLSAHLSCSRDAQFNCLRDPTEFQARVQDALRADPVDSFGITNTFGSSTEETYYMSRAYDEAIQRRWAFATFPDGQTCALHRSELMLDAEHPDPSPEPSRPDNHDPLAPLGGSDPLARDLGDWGWSRGEQLRSLAATLRLAAADQQRIAEATGPVPFETLKSFGPTFLEEVLQILKGIAPLPADRARIAAAGRAQIDKQTLDETAIAQIDRELMRAPLADRRLATALRIAGGPLPPTAASDQYERFLVALLGSPDDRVYVQNVALGLVLTSVTGTARSTVVRHIAATRPHLLLLGGKLDHSFGATAAISVSESAIDPRSLQSQSVAQMLTDIGPFQVPRLEICTQTFTGLPFGLDKTLGIPTSLVTLAGAAVWYPVNAAISVWQETISIFRADLLTGFALILLAGLSLGLAIKVQLDGLNSRTEKFIGVAVAVLLFPLYLWAVVGMIALIYSSFLAAQNWFLALLSVPLVSLSLFLFPKVVAVVALVPTRVRTLSAKLKDD